jgi:hypothetical protein
MLQVHIEVTDTFGGEANYSWVRRHTIPHKAGESRRSLVRRAKAEMGWTGVRCKVDDYGDTIRMDQRGACVCCFIETRED